MMEITFTEDPSKEELEALTRGLSQHAKEEKDLEPMEPFGFFYRDQGKVVGGCSGWVFYGALHIDQLWVDDAYRNQGTGSSLVARAEAYAQVKQCRMVTLITMNWEAPDLYKRLGYEVDHIRSGYAADSSLIFMKKDIAAD